MIIALAAAIIIPLVLGTVQVVYSYVYPPSTGYPYPHDEFGRPYSNSNTNGYSGSGLSSNSYSNGFGPPSVGYPYMHSYFNPYQQFQQYQQYQSQPQQQYQQQQPQLQYQQQSQYLYQYNQDRNNPSVRNSLTRLDSNSYGNSNINIGYSSSSSSSSSSYPSYPSSQPYDYLRQYQLYLYQQYFQHPTSNPTPSAGYPNGVPLPSGNTNTNTNIIINHGANANGANGANGANSVSANGASGVNGGNGGNAVSSVSVNQVNSAGG